MTDDDRGRLHAVFQTILAWEAHTDDRGAPLAALDELLGEARAILGAGHAVTIDIEFHREELAGRADPRRNDIERWARLLDHSRRALGEDHLTVMRIRQMYARQLRLRGSATDLDTGITLYREELERRERVLGPDHYQTGIVRTNLVTALRDLGTPSALAEAALLIDSEATRRAWIYGSAHHLTWAAWGLAAEVALDRADLEPEAPHAENALKVADRLIELRTGQFGHRNHTTLRARRLKARALHRLGRSGESAGLLRRVRLVEQLTDGQSSADTESLLAQSLRGIDPGRALEAAEEALHRLRSERGEDSWQVRKARRAVAELECAQFRE